MGPVLSDNMFIMCFSTHDGIYVSTPHINVTDLDRAGPRPLAENGILYLYFLKLAKLFQHRTQQVLQELLPIPGNKNIAITKFIHDTQNLLLNIAPSH